MLINRRIYSHDVVKVPQHTAWSSIGIIKGIRLHMTLILILSIISAGQVLRDGGIAREQVLLLAPRDGITEH